MQLLVLFLVTLNDNTSHKSVESVVGFSLFLSILAYQRGTTCVIYQHQVTWNSELSPHLIFATNLERFAIECRKTKTKLITLANHKRQRQSSEPMNSQQQHVAGTKRGKTRVTIGLGFTSDWLRKWRDISKPITKHSNAELKQMRITVLSTLEGEPLY